jgi:hypothetical protein
MVLGAGPLFMEMDGYWRYLWVYAEREISNDKLASESKSAASRKGHQTRAEKIEAKEWEIGDGFKDAAAKHRAKDAVLSTLETFSQKEISKAEPILRSIISDLSKEGLREEEILSNKTQRRIITVDAMIESASSLIKLMTKK